MVNTYDLQIKGTMETNTLNQGIKDFTLTVLNPCPYETVSIDPSILSSYPNIVYNIYNEAIIEIIDWDKISNWS